MNSAVQPTERSERILAIDVLRGITIFLMVFFNEIAGMAGIPGWLRHMPGAVDGMTVVDVVFPAFLFIVGMAVPQAMERRLAAGDSPWRIWGHILLRSGGLLLLGIFMVNAEYGVDGRALGSAAWRLLLYSAAVLLWARWPGGTIARRRAAWVIRAAAIVVLLLLVVDYRDEAGGGMAFRWWGILGLIGWSYLAVSAVYFLWRRNLAAHVLLTALFLAFYIWDRSRGGEGEVTWRFGLLIGSHGAVAMCGLLLGVVVGRHSPAVDHAARLRWCLGLAAAFAAGGWLLRPLYGINKNQASPSWCLYSAALSCLAFALLYWLLDMRGLRRWSGLFAAAGTNPLLAYVLPEWAAAVVGALGWVWWERFLVAGWPGVIRGLVWAAVLCGLAGWLGRRRLRLQF